MTDLDPRLLEVVRQRNLGSLATIKRDGRPQLSISRYLIDGWLGGRW